ncbi:hypothetical protein GCM10011374_24100 [Kocuria dechangensis]|uniref:DUF5666 domain-containing protein n=2 Tax=Kocuria dechangensis TaxID=1176249 RepID=A0A917GXH6_9MICC|nr:hypothetical protein GCM10011374_24100 [Kocuria dechangensis]
MMSHHDRRPRRAAAAAVAVAAFGLSACGSADPSPGAPAEQLLDPETLPTGPYAGAYDQAFAADLEHYAEQEVTLHAQVGTVVNPVAFTLTALEDTAENTGEGGAVAPLLVVEFDDTPPELRPGDAVEVTGTVHEAYNVPDTEENLGDPPGPEVLASYDGQPFLEATSVDTSTPQATALQTTAPAS